MKIVSFSVTNYRSITTARKIKLSQFTVLVGKNNEGKSNLLKALNLSMDIMILYAHNADFPEYINRYVFSGNRNTNLYDWERDFPLSLKNKEKVKPTTFDLSFDLNDSEIRGIKDLTGIRMGNIIPIRITIDDKSVSIDIPKRGSASFKKHAQEIILFVCSRISFKYIPAVRTEQGAMKVINSLIRKNFVEHKKDPEYLDALEKLREKNQEILDDIAIRIKEPLSVFIPNINNVEITTWSIAEIII